MNTPPSKKQKITQRPASPMLAWLRQSEIGVTNSGSDSDSDSTSMISKKNDIKKRRTGFGRRYSLGWKLLDRMFPPVIELNVGGTHYTTSLLTLTKCKDNMLSAMFSGNYNVTQDKDGRYFIDADGDYFIYILNYLRYGELPPPHLAERVYREAVYFGIHGLIEELNQYPNILAAIQRDKFRAQFPGYSDCISSILSTALRMNSEKVDTSSDVFLLLYARENQSDDEDFKLFHICLHDSDEQGEITSDAKLGPWRNTSSEQEVFKCLLFDLEKKGFIVTGYYMGKCNYKCGPDECRKLYYKLTFHWWKS